MKHHIEAILPYRKRLHLEAESRIREFAMHRCFYYDEILQVMAGERWMGKVEAATFLRMVRRAGGAMPPHLENCPDIYEPTNCTLVQARDAVWFHLKTFVKTGDGAFFKQLASLMEAPPVTEDFDGFVKTVRTFLHERRIMYPKTDATPRGRCYLQRLILAIFEISIDVIHKLPSVDDIREGIARLMEKPPIRRDFDLALKAVGLARPVLV